MFSTSFWISFFSKIGSREHRHSTPFVRTSTSVPSSTSFCRRGTMISFTFFLSTVCPMTSYVSFPVANSTM